MLVITRGKIIIKSSIDYRWVIFKSYCMGGNQTLVVTGTMEFYDFPYLGNNPK